MKELFRKFYTYVLCKKHKIPFLSFKPGKGLTIVNYRYGGVTIGRNTVIGQRDILCSHSKNSILKIGANTLIGRDSTISAINSIIIDDDVLTGPHVFIADYNHEYQSPKIPIKNQGNRANKGDRVLIERGTWIGTNAVIVGNVHIGKNCVIGANSVVTKDIPDYCVFAGVPAKIIRKYDELSNSWLRV